MRENPLRSLRTSHGLTQHYIAEKAGVSALAVLRYEQGLYDSPSPKLIDALSEYYPLGRQDLIDAYQAWRIMKQEDSRDCFKPWPQVLIGNEHPFATFRKVITQRAVGKSSKMSFCVLLAIHPATLYSYEHSRLTHIPSVIKSALHNAGVTGEHISELDHLGVVYNERRVA